jgi:hypothetical protein
MVRCDTDGGGLDEVWYGRIAEVLRGNWGRRRLEIVTIATSDHVYKRRRQFVVGVQLSSELGVFDNCFRSERIIAYLFNNVNLPFLRA